ncbi:hypothetical protein BGY98DRAFT_586512 [Russula aff. rugulosa BPL654]|nr:hypothetical protein BGY98DRAFT_586512 [Russula aff. rugulosa BPL654]
MFSVVAIGIMSYALYTYHWRAQSIRKGGRGHMTTGWVPHSFAPLFWENSPLWLLILQLFASGILRSTSSTTRVLGLVCTVNGKLYSFVIIAQHDVSRNLFLGSHWLSVINIFTVSSSSPYLSHAVSHCQTHKQGTSTQ